MTGGYTHRLSEYRRIADDHHRIAGENLQRFEMFTNIGCLFYEVLAVALVFARVYKYRKAGGTGGLIEL